MRTFLLMTMLAAVMAGPVAAQEKAAPVPADETAAPAEPAPQSAPVNPHIQEMNDKARELAGVLTEEEAKTLSVIRDNFGILRSVGIARKSVDEAVSLCAKENPDLKKEITARHKQWDQKIGAALDHQENTLDGEITKERFQDPAMIKDYLGTIDKAAYYADENIEKKIITTAEACKNLMASMDETQRVILELVDGMKWPTGAAADKPKDAAP